MSTVPNSTWRSEASRKTGDDELQQLARDPGMLVEELVEVGDARDVDLDRLEGDDRRGSWAAVDGAHLAQQAPGVEDRQDHLTVPARGY